MTTLEKAARAWVLEALEYMTTQTAADYETNKTINALRQAIEAAEKQKPVAWMWEFDDEGAAFSTCEPTASIKDGVNYFPLYTAPPQGEWVGLTDEEFDFLVPYCENKFDLEDYKTFARAIEAKLKEKNT